MFHRSSIFASAVAAILCAGPAAASTVLNLTDTVTRTINGSPDAVGNYTVTSSGLTANGTIDPTVTLSIGNAFNGPGQIHTGLDFGALATGSGGPWNFQDDYAFSTSGASIYSATIALPSFGSGSNVGLTDIQARFIYGAIAGNPVNAPPTLGPPTGGAVAGAWQTFNLGANGSYTVTMPKEFAAGDYILQIRGEALSGGGSYGGTVAFTPVPLPAAAWFLLSGIMTLLPGLKRRTRAGTPA